MYKYGVIVIGYKNQKSIQRLLEQLNRAEYGKDQILLIISIDYSGEDLIKKYAESYEWQHGEKLVIAYDKRQGLKNHILECGDYLEKYDLDAAAIFEDDTFPAVDYYNYMKAATKRYYEDSNIAGVSLYAHGKNLYANESFWPIKTEEDAYFLQYAQSWGQVWFRNRWKEFKEWYDKNNGEIGYKSTIPMNVSGWNESSWLKYHIKYCIEMKKYFVYPYVARSTCFSEEGEHTIASSDQLQLSLFAGTTNEYRFPLFTDESLKYDAFFENESLYKFCGVDKEDLEVDLYGMRVSTQKRYLLSKKRLNYPIVKSWGNHLKPHELNVVYDVKGKSIFLYDLGEHLGIEIPKCDKPKEKFKAYFDISDKLLLLYEQGNFEKVSEYFINNDIATIAVYGYGKLAKHFIQLIGHTNIKVAYAIDKRAVSIEGDLKILQIEDELPQVDCIVVTPVIEYEGIKEKLNSKFSGKIISLEELF